MVAADAAKQILGMQASAQQAAQVRNHFTAAKLVAADAAQAGRLSRLVLYKLGKSSGALTIAQATFAAFSLRRKF